MTGHSDEPTYALYREVEGGEEFVGEVTATEDGHVKVVDGKTGDEIYHDGDRWVVPAIRTDAVDAVADVVVHEGDDPQARLDAADPNETVAFDPGHRFTVESAVRVETDGLTVLGARTRQADAASTEQFVIEGDHVRFKYFDLDGNRSGNDTGEGRASNLRVAGNGVVVEGGVVRNATRHGVHVWSPDGESRDVTVRDVTAIDPEYDGVSLEGPDLVNPTAETIRVYGSARRGGLEVNDGVTGATVRNVYAENCDYVVDFQDHGNEGEDNRDTLVENVRGENCTHAVRGDTTGGIGHANLTIRGIRGSFPGIAVTARHVDGVTIEDVRVEGMGNSAVHVDYCDDVVLSDVHDRDTDAEVASIQIWDSSDVEFLGGATTGDGESLIGIFVRLRGRKTMERIRIHGYHADVDGDGILIRNDSDSWTRRKLGDHGIPTGDRDPGTIRNYVVTHNFAAVDDAVGDADAIVEKNLPP